MCIRESVYSDTIKIGNELIKKGIDINQSIKLIRNIRPGSIETEEQEKFVRNFKLI